MGYLSVTCYVSGIVMTGTTYIDDGNVQILEGELSGQSNVINSFNISLSRIVQDFLMLGA